MATYRYKCPGCEHVFDVFKSICEIDDYEICPECNLENIDGSNRLIGNCYFYGEKADDPFYSVSLGKVVSSKKQQLAEAKARGWEEVGNTDIEKHIDRTNRHREERLSARWDDLLRG